MSGQVVNLNAERFRRAVEAQPLIKAAVDTALNKPGVPVITEEQSSTLGALYRRFYQEMNQLVGFMEQIGIAGDASRDMRTKAHNIKNEILAARVRRDLAK